MARILVTEEIADRGLDLLRGRRPRRRRPARTSPRRSCSRSIAGADALIIRSATQVDRRGPGRGADLVVVGRAGIGLDNVDVEAATRRGVMVVNAPQSNIVSAAEHTMALLLAQARNVPQAHAALKAGRWERSRWEGVELADKTLGIVGLGRIGRLVAQRALAFGMRLVAYDPFVSAERARQMSVELLPLERLVERGRLRHHPPAQDQGHHRPVRQGAAGRAKPGLRLINVARGGIVDEEALAWAVREGVVGRRRARRVRHRADHVVAAVRARRGGRDAPPRRVDPRGPGQGRRHDRRDGAAGPGRRVRALRGERVGRRGVGDRAALPAAWPSGSGRLFAVAGRGPARQRSRSATRASSPTTTPASSPCRCCGACSAASVDEPVTYVNAPQLAKDHGFEVRETSCSTAVDYVNLVTLRAGEPRPGRHDRRPPRRAPHRDGRRPHHRRAAVGPHARGPQRRPAGDDRRRRHAARRGRHQHRRHGRRPGRRGRVRRSW